MPPVLEIEGVVGGYTDLDILRGVTAHADEGELVTVIGPNGAGKSTLLKAVMGLIHVRAGEIRLHGKGLRGLRPEAVVASGVAYVPQVDNVFATLTVAENLDMGAFLRVEGTPEARERVLATFPDLRPRLKQRASKLSGGQRQMLAIGRALMQEPKVVLLDEPTAALAPRLQDEVLELVVTIARRHAPVLLVEQNAKKALARSDRAYVLEQGANRFEGSGEELLADERIGRLYLAADPKPSDSG